MSDGSNEMSVSDDSDDMYTSDCSERPDEKLAKDILRTDLTKVLRHGFNFKGKFAFSMSLPYSPNPCLHIDGIGIVGLPLSDRDANLIASAGSPTSTSRRITPQDSIVIDSSRVSYKNPKWEPYVDEVIRERVWKKLIGCAPNKTAPRYEFRKLLLQKPGSRFFSFEDAETLPVGAFSTVVIVLPSEFVGGEIRASHGDRSLTLAPAKGSLYGTTLLAWYTDVTYEAENLASGFRLALVYNLVHTSTKIPVPCIPSNYTLVSHAREVFHKWISSSYKHIPDAHIAAYVLHDGDNLTKSDVLSVLKVAADAENITLLLGKLYAHVTGYAEASTDEPDHPAYGLSHGTFDGPVMETVEVAKFKIGKLTDPWGKFTRNKSRFIINEENLVPEFPFMDIEPDKQNAHRFAHGGSPLEYQYQRPVLVLFPSSKQLDVLLASGGVEFALTELEKPTQEGRAKENHKIVEFIFNNWRKTPSEDSVFSLSSYEVPTMTTRQTTIRLASIAIRSNDVGLWVRTMGMYKFRYRGDLSHLELEHIVAGWKKFRLQEIETALDRIVNGLRDVQSTVMILTALQNSKKVLHPDPQRDQWLSGHLDRSFSKKVDESDIDSIMKVACSKGLDYVARVIMPPLLTKRLDAPEWAQVVESLWGSQDQLLALPPSHGQTLSNAELFDRILNDVTGKLKKGGAFQFFESEGDDFEYDF